jgi:hypothetical protein
MGEEGDATPFMNVTVEDFCKALHECGYQLRGNEVRAHVYVCVCVMAYVVRLSHITHQLSHQGDVQRAHVEAAAGTDLHRADVLPASEAHGG